MRSMLLIVMIFFSGSAAAQTVPDDTVLADLYSACLESLVPNQEDGLSVTAALSFAPGIEPSETVMTLTEAFLTSRGYALTDIDTLSVPKIRITILDTRVTIHGEHGRFRRSIQLSVHIRCTDANGIITSAGGAGLSRSDVIPGSALRPTDTCDQFSQSVSRRNAGGGPGKKVLASFLVFSAAIWWFGFR